jgi:hypothetical protein
MENVVMDGPEITDKKTVYDGYFKVEEYQIKDGDKEYTREKNTLEKCLKEVTL